MLQEGCMSTAWPSHSPRLLRRASLLIGRPDAAIPPYLFLCRIKITNKEAVYAQTPALRNARTAWTSGLQA